MINITPFSALRPEAQLAKAVAAKPYDVLNSKEARIEAQGNPNTFLHITKSEIDLPETIDIHSKEVYQKAKENLDAFVSRNVLFREAKPCYYIYRLIMDGRAQTGLVCGSSIQDYESGLIKKHEFTRPEKELDRITHIQTTGAQTGNVFLAYRNVDEIDQIINNWTTTKNPQYDFIADDQIQHSVWIVSDDRVIRQITETFHRLVPCSYIADGHHRAASAAKVKSQSGANSVETDYFLTTLFPANQLQILDYNRVITDLNGLAESEFLEKLAQNFEVHNSLKAVKPQEAHQFGMYLSGSWYSLTCKPGTFSDDPIGILDVSILQAQILDPILGIKDQRTDKRIDFVGGIRGLEELERRVNDGEMKLAFSIFPVSTAQLFTVADSGKVMPPKSTWFEPKLRDGLLTHLIS